MSMMKDVPVMQTAPTYRLDIYMAGDINVAKQVCREFCLRGCCVHIEPVDYIYTGGEETGFKVGLINYPRFNNSLENLIIDAKELGKMLMVGCHQGSFTLVTPNQSFWYSRRKDD